MGFAVIFEFVNQYKRYIPIVAVILVALGVNLDKFGIDLQALSRGNSSSISSNSKSSSTGQIIADAGTGHQKPAYKQWSATRPEINLWHIFEGEINRSGKPVGFHSRPAAKDPANAKLISVRDGPNKVGVYTATIAIRDGQQWKEKFSSFFPDSLSKKQVTDAVINAYKKSKNAKKQPWQGPSGLGFQIQGYTSNRGGINTAFPVYRR